MVMYGTCSPLESTHIILGLCTNCTVALHSALRIGLYVRSIYQYPYPVCLCVCMSVRVFARLQQPSEHRHTVQQPSQPAASCCARTPHPNGIRTGPECCVCTNLRRTELLPEEGHLLDQK
jgi:hypothetical protein